MHCPVTKWRFFVKEEVLILLLPSWIRWEKLWRFDNEKLLPRSPRALPKPPTSRPSANASVFPTHQYFFCLISQCRFVFFSGWDFSSLLYCLSLLHPAFSLALHVFDCFSRLCFFIHSCWVRIRRRMSSTYIANSDFLENSMDWKIGCFSLKHHINKTITRVSHRKMQALNWRYPPSFD